MYSYIVITETLFQKLKPPELLNELLMPGVYFDANFIEICSWWSNKQYIRHPLWYWLSAREETCHHLNHWWPGSQMHLHYGPLTRYVKLRVAHAPGTFSPPPTSKETDSYRSQQASWHVRDACSMMHVGIASPHCRCMRNPQFYVSGKRLIGSRSVNCSCNGGDDTHFKGNHDDIVVVLFIIQTARWD